MRTATKRAGGTVRNHGHSPGKRLGVKKFSGLSNSNSSCRIRLAHTHIRCRPSCDPRKHHRQATRDSIPPRPTRTLPFLFSVRDYQRPDTHKPGWHGTGPYHLRTGPRLCSILQNETHAGGAKIRRSGAQPRGEAT